MSSYRLCDGKSLVVEDASISWSNRVGAQTSMNISIVESSPSDSINDTFATAIEDDENETRYLSVLETTRDITLEDLPNISVSNTKIDSENLELSSESETSSLTDSGEHQDQVVIFKLEGSDDLYGIQVAQDEEGNIQKYQFQFRTRDDGQLEAIPDTIQLLPNDSDDNQDNQEYLEDETDVDTREGRIDVQSNEIVQKQVFITEETSSDSVHSNVLLEKRENALVGENDENQVECHGAELNEMNENTLLVLIKNESEVGEGAINGPELGDNYSEDDAIDVKPELLELQGTNQEVSAVNIKQECHIKSIQNEDGHIGEAEEFSCGETEIHEETVIGHSVECHSEAETYDTDTQDEETLIEYQHFDSQGIDEVCEETNHRDNESDQHQDNMQEEHYSNIFIENGQIEEITSNAELHQHVLEDVHFMQEEIRDESDNEDYEIVDGLPVTAEGDISEDSSSPIYEQESMYSEEIIQQLPLRKHNTSMTTNILKQQMDSNNAKDSQKKTILYYMVHTTDQKENVNSLPLGGETIVPIKPNPRSLLKNNVEVKLQDNNQLILEKAREREKLLEKRYARSKEAVQAKLFNNFINKTTIPHAPVRQIRLPRKQQILPVDTRRNEEIIVQEVMVSSKGFIENSNDRLKSKDKLEVTSIVELSDTDEEYNPNNSSKKKKKHKKLVQVFAATSEDSDTSVIEILHSDEELDKFSKKSPGRPKKSMGDVLKRPRGRPPKHDGSSPQKKSKTESSEMESDSGKKEVKCPHCSKSFPSQNSLNTHIQHHNLENSLRNSTRFSIMEYKHKCDQCEEKFKNSILLKRHVCQKKDAKLKCSVCSKCFNDVSLFNIHKKTHVKQNLVKTTTTVTISPKKFLPRPSTSTFKSFKKPSPTYKCQRCSKSCPTQASLTIHEKSHRNFTCTNCRGTFASKILLDTHVRLTCVKQLSPKNRRLSFKIRKSFVQSPRTVSQKRKSVNPGLNSVSMSRPLDVEVTCDSCAEKFSTLTALFKHKVKDHGLQTPDKKVLVSERKTLHKPLNTHGGIPASDRLNRAFQGLREKFATRNANCTILENPESK